MDKKIMRIVAGVLLGLSLLFMAVGANCLLSPASYQATTWIAVAKSKSGVWNAVGSELGTFVHSFFQTELAQLHSKVVLYQVITNLNLNKKWAEKLKEEELNIDRTYKLLKKHIDLRQSRNTSLFEIRVSSRDKADAAQIANEIATVYRDLRIAQAREISALGIKTLEREWEWQNQKVTNAQALVERLRKELNISDAEAEASGPKVDSTDTRSSFFRVKRDMEELKRVRERVVLRIIQEKVDQSIPKSSAVRIMDRAKPPSKPTRPNRPLGWTMLATGAVFGIIGFFLLNES